MGTLFTIFCSRSVTGHHEMSSIEKIGFMHVIPARLDNGIVLPHRRPYHVHSEYIALLPIQ